MAQCLDILVGQQLGELVAPFERQYRCDRVEFLRAGFDLGKLFSHQILPR